MASVRVFFGVEEEWFQIFSIEQKSNDASIYLSASEFADMTWLAPTQLTDQRPVLLAYKATAPGKLSLHGSGVAHVKPYESPNPADLTISGNMLRSADAQTLNTRHLLTVILTEPRHRPPSPARARASDYLMVAKHWHPYVLILWAVPAVSGTVEIESAFQVDDLEEVPPNCGYGNFNLSLHSIVWFAYRTRHMQRWPQSAQAAFSDGYTVPIFVGTGLGECRLEYRQPKYSHTERGIKVVL